MSSVRIALIGNCQVQTLSMLSRLMLAEVDIKVLDYSERLSRDEDTRREFADSLADRDLIFTQTAVLSHTNERDLRQRYESKVVTIANFYFRGVFPDSCYVGDFAHRLDQPSAVNSVVVLDAFRRGLDKEEAVRSFCPESFARLGLLNAWASSMHEMGLREANNVVDVPGGGVMEDACRAYPAFHTMNHPSAPLLTEYLARVFRFAGLPHGHIDAARLPDPLAQHDTCPVLDFIAEHYNLPYRTSQSWRINSLNRRFIGLDEYVARCYEAYRGAPSSALLCNSPADMVRTLRSDAGLAYLVDSGAPVPDRSAVPLPARRRAASFHMAMGMPEDGPMQTSLDELKLYTHKVHSFLQIADPKVEHIVQALSRIEAARAEPPPPVPPPAAISVRAMAALTACALLGGLAGSLIAALL